MSARATHSPGPAHPTLSRCHGRHAPIPVTDESAEKLQNCTRSTRVQSKAKTPNHTRPTDLTAHPTFHKSISTRPIQPNPQIDSTTPVAEDANDSANTAIGTHSVQIRSKVRGGFRPIATSVKKHGIAKFQSALRFAVVSDFFFAGAIKALGGFQSALRFAVVSDAHLDMLDAFGEVSIRFEVRGGFRQVPCQPEQHSCQAVSIRFEVRGGFRRHSGEAHVRQPFQSALRFAVVSDLTIIITILVAAAMARFNPL